MLPHDLLLTHKWQKPELISCWAESLRDSTFPIASNSSNNCMHCNFLKNQAIKLKYGFARNTDRSIGEWITIEIYLTRLNLCQMCLEILGITNTVKQAETCTRLNRSMKNSSMLMTYLERTAWANFCCWNKTCVLDWCKLHSGWWYACCGWTSFALRQGRDGAVTQRPAYCFGPWIDCQVSPSNELKVSQVLYISFYSDLMESSGTMVWQFPFMHSLICTTKKLSKTVLL